MAQGFGAASDSGHSFCTMGALLQKEHFALTTLAEPLQSCLKDFGENLDEAEKRLGLTAASRAKAS
jgi:hypothetical protein